MNEPRQLYKKQMIWLLAAVILGLALTGCQVDPSATPRFIDTQTHAITLIDKVLHPEAAKAKQAQSKAAVKQSGVETTFWVQPGTPAYLANFTHPELGCKWMGVAGQVFDLQGNPVNSIVINIGGTFNANPGFTALGVTGTTDLYGPQGFEVALSSAPTSSTHSLWIQLTDIQGKAVSEKVYFDTSADCQKNLILINFKESPVHRTYFPTIANNPAPAGQ